MDKPMTAEMKPEQRHCDAAIEADEGAIGAARALSSRDCGATQSEMRDARKAYLAEFLARFEASLSRPEAEPPTSLTAEGLLAWLQEATPRTEHCESDFSQGVRRGFEIVAAQVEHGHVQAFIAERRSGCKTTHIEDGFPENHSRVEVPASGPVAKELLRAVMKHTNLSDPPTYNAPALANEAFLVGYRAALAAGEAEHLSTPADAGLRELIEDAVPILEVLVEEREEAIGEECEISRDLLSRFRAALQSSQPPTSLDGDQEQS